MKKLLVFLLPFMMFFVQGCSKEYSLETISMSCVVPENPIVSADGGEIIIKVSSTHSFQITCDQQGICSFLRNGDVDYDKEGVAIIETNHEVFVSSNNTGGERRFYIIATNKYNPEIKSSIAFIQPAK